MSPSSRGIDRIAVTFDEPGLVGNAGLFLVVTLVKRLGLESLIDAMVRIPSARGGFAPGRKVLTLVHAMVAGATHIDHADVLRAGATEEVFPHRVMAPSTLGTFLRAFTFGHVRQLVPWPQRFARLRPGRSAETTRGAFTMQPRRR